MFKLRTASASKHVAAQRKPTAGVTAAPVLITEQQVLLSTAAAVGLPRRRHLTDAVAQAMSSAARWWRTRAERRPARPCYPARMSFMEDALMSREMDRL
jgi:hypothetical protein